MPEWGIGSPSREPHTPRQDVLGCRRLGRWFGERKKKKTDLALLPEPASTTAQASKFPSQLELGSRPNRHIYVIGLWRISLTCDAAGNWTQVLLMLSTYSTTELLPNPWAWLLAQWLLPGVSVHGPPSHSLYFLLLEGSSGLNPMPECILAAPRSLEGF